MRPRVDRLAPVVGAPLLLALAAGSLSGQTDGRSEGVFLRQAAALESGGDLEGAEELLRELMAEHPSASGGLFALERVLRARGTVEEILPVADAYLDAEPGAGAAHQLKLRVMLEVDSLESLEAEARRWIEAEPASEEPWREAARALEQAWGPERALAFLREGRESLGRPAALALEIGDALVDAGRPGEAVVEWGRAVGADGVPAESVVRRMEDLEGAGAEGVGALLSALDAEPTTLERRRAAIRIALGAGLSEEAVDLADKVVSDLPDDARDAFLMDLVRQGEAAGAGDVILWAFDRMRGMEDDARERSALDARIASAALTAGDTARALEAQERLARDLPAGSAERRRVVADLIRVEVGKAAPEELAGRLEGFRSEFPDAPELDALGAAVAAGLQARGEVEAAAEILDGIQGPRSALERGYLLLGADDVEGAQVAFGAAVPELSPSAATPVIQLLGLLGRLSPAGQALAAETALLAHRDRAGEAVQRFRAALEDLPAADRPPLLAQGARLADEGGLPAEAAELRAELLAAHPDAPEVGEATLALARYRARRPEGVEEAVRLLEALIVARPHAPVVPDARRELERLRRRGEGEGS